VAVFAMGLVWGWAEFMAGSFFNVVLGA
jgi:hypothetical protein